MAAKTPAKKSSKSPRAAARPTAAKAGKKAVPKAVKKAAPKAVKKVAPKAAPKAAPKVAKKAAPKAAPAKRAAAPKVAKPVRSARTAKITKPARPAQATKPESAKSAKAAKGKKVAAGQPPAKAPAPKRAGKVETPAVRPAAPAPPRVPGTQKKPSKSGAKESGGKQTGKPGIVPEAPPVDMGFFRVLLAQKREELLAMYRNDLRLGQEASDGPTEDIVDRANNSYTRELSFSISDAERTRVLQIDAALVRIDKGTFGRCGHCNREIPEVRLVALPWANLCVECQELLEKGLLADA